ncbi:MAG: glucose 1-dehydrogenase [Balneolaceae bacterium]|nr:glucose 1-dehydrogenase [Balneolaceae bacterium]
MSIEQQLDLDGQVAIVTGSSRGIGKAIAGGLARCGAQVIISSRSQDSCDETAAEFEAEGLKAIAIACHVGKQEHRKALVEQVVNTFGRADILVNNAAVNPVYGPIEEVEAAVFDKIMDINVKACWQLSNLVQPHMKKNNKGSIINIASVEGLKPGEGLGLYSTSKAALIMLTKSQAKEWGRYDIRANAICPGLIKTKFSQALWKDDSVLGTIEKTLPSGRMGQPREMIGLACLLASDAGSYMTGGIYTADGGYMISG